MQIAVVDPYSILTIELTGIHGIAELYAAKEYLPSTSKHMLKDSNMGKSPEKVTRMIFETNGYTGYIFLAVFSPQTGCKYQLWAVSSGPPISDSNSMAEVGKTIRGLSVLANHPNDVLHVQFPVLYKVAHDIAESEANIKHSSILAQMNDAKKLEQEQAVAAASSSTTTATGNGDFSPEYDQNVKTSRVAFSTSTKGNAIDTAATAAAATVSTRVETDKRREKEIDEDEYNALDRYIQKIGRKDYRKEIEKDISFPSDVSGLTPFMHPDMFGKSGVETQAEFANYAIQPVTPPHLGLGMGMMTDDMRSFEDDIDPVVRRAPISYDSYDNGDGFYGYNNDNNNNDNGSRSWDENSPVMSPTSGGPDHWRPNNLAQLTIPKSKSSSAILQQNQYQHQPVSLTMPSLHSLDSASSAVVSAAGSSINDAFVGLFLSRSSTLPKLHGHGNKAQVSVAAPTAMTTTATTAAANNKKSQANNSKHISLPAGPYLPMLVPPASGVPSTAAVQQQQQQKHSLASTSGTNSSSAKNVKYSDGLLKQARNPVVVKYTLRKF